LAIEIINEKEAHETIKLLTEVYGNPENYNDHSENT